MLFRSGVAPEFLHAVTQRCANRKKEGGENQVSRGEAMPCSVLQRVIHKPPIPGRIHDDHEGNGEASEDI